MVIKKCELKSETAKKTRTGPSYVRVIQIEYAEGFSAPGILYASDHCDDVGADPTTALLWHYGMVHPDDGRAVVTEVSVADPVADGEDPQEGYCDFTITLSPITADYQLSPLERPPEIEWGGGEDQTEGMQKDYDGNYSKNSSGDFYDPLPEWDIPGADVTITRYEADNPADLLPVYSKSINSAALWGQAIATMKFGKITAQKVYENNVPYWKVKYPIYITTKENGWKLMLIDNGYRVKQTDGSLRRHTDDMGQHSPVPVLLDGTGKELASGATPVVFPSTGLRRNASQPWAALGLPNPYA